VTVVVGVAAPDGVVLAADSRTTSFPDGMGDQARYRIITDTADKLFTIRDRFAVAT
jgi:20S proteasome alpha/beta subunit